MECSSEVRKNEIKYICKLIDEKYDSSIHLGVLLCEGNKDSIDVKLYTKVYPYLAIIPTGGCTDVIKLIHSIRKRNEDKLIFGLIDRDTNSKTEIKKLEREKGVYCTKLPFIENIICTPEVIKILCRYLNQDYRKTIKEINESVLKSLTNKIKEALPVNVSISRDELIDSIAFSIKKKDGSVVQKTVNESSVLYSYKDKTIASIVADAFMLKGRHAYYDFIAEMLEEPLVSHDLLIATRAYLPMIKT